MRHFAHNIGDYAAATAHLSFIEDAAYHRCLRRYYQDERALPGDVAQVCRLVGARSREEQKAVANVLAEFFHLEEDGYHQDRADREIEVYHSKADAARLNGAKGGRPANRRKTNPVSSPVQSEKLTTPHSPLPTPQIEEGGAGAPCASDEVGIAFDEFTKAATDCGWPKPRALEADRRKKLKSRLEEHGLDGWRQVMANARASEFLRSKFALKLDWVLEPRNFRKVLEGNYGAVDGAATPSTSSDEIQWAARVRGWTPGRFWNRGDWGPPPNEPGCRAPAHLLTPWRPETLQ